MFCSKKNNKKNKKKIIAVVRLQGVIGKVGFSSGLTLNGLKHLEKIKKIKNLSAIALIINSPGGSPVQSDLISKKIALIASEHKKQPKIYSFCEDLAASGGYWLACTGEEIFAMDASIVGSIGVISQGFGFKELIKKIGIERRVISQGKNKSVLDPFSDSKPEDIELLKNIQKEVHISFINQVKNSRKDRLKGSDEEIFNGKFWTGASAESLGLIDGIGYYEEVLKEKYGDKIEYKEISAPKGFIAKKLSSFYDGLGNKILGKVEESILFNRYK